MIPQGGAKTYGHPIGHMWHIETQEADEQAHIRDHWLRVNRWQDVAKWAMENIDHAHDRKACIDLYATRGIDLAMIPFICSHDPQRAEWIEDEEELYWKLVREGYILR